MSPQGEDFVSFKETAPRGLTAADQGAFHAICIGDTIISVPNKNDSCKIRLTNVLYTPDLGSAALVSMGEAMMQGTLLPFGE
jgi:hypothetical protein